jgi:hypothetical protein
VLFVGILIAIKAYLLDNSDGALGTLHVPAQQAAPFGGYSGMLAADGLYFRGGDKSPYCLTCCGCLVLEEMAQKGLLSKQTGYDYTGVYCEYNYDMDREGTYGPPGETALANITNFITELELPAFVYAPSTAPSAAAVMDRVGNYTSSRVKGFETVAEVSLPAVLEALSGFISL